MKVLVTGAAGFVGRHMVRALEARGDTVIGIDLRPAPNVYFGYHERDLLWLLAQEATHYDLVVHCAASSPHRVAIDREPEHLARNLHLDSALFDWAVRTGQGRVLYLSSSAAYPVRFQQGETTAVMTEGMVLLDDVIQPDAGYGWGKVTGEMMAAAARRAGLAVTVVRPFSGYGEDQSEDFPFGAFAARARRRDDPFTIWGDGSQVRDWIHVDDVVAGALVVADAGVEEPVNLCTGRGTSMNELAGMFAAAAGYRPWFELRRDQPAGVAYRVGDPRRMREHYQPRVELEDGILRALAVR